MKKELKQTVELFLSTNDISYNKEELHLQLLAHPYFPSINAVTDLFDHFKIENIAAELPKEISIISELPTSFLAHIKEDNDEKIILVIKKGNELKLIYDAKQKKKISYADFIAIWTGVIVAIEKGENTIEETTSKAVSYLKMGSYLLLSVLTISAFVFNPINITEANYVLVTFMGLYTSILLVQKELGLHSKSLDKFCEASESNSCDDILNSKGALVFGVFKLSDVGIVYFSAIIFSVLVYGLSGVEINNHLFYNLSILSLLFIPYSIYYQWQVIKKWCPLCLVVLGILLVQGLIVFLFTDITFSFSQNELIIPIISFLIIGIIWSELKSGLKKKQEFEVLQLEHYKFKRNSSLFLTALKSSKQKDMYIEGVNEIVFGNKEASLQIVLVTNPRCFFCKEAHQVFHDILKNREENIQLVIRFNINTSFTEGNSSLEISNQLLEIYTSQSKNKALQALDEIYSDMEPDVWLQKWKSTTFLSHTSDLEKAKDWCTKNAVNFTPAIFINGYLFPKEYNKKDITFFIDDLIEEGL